MLHKVNILHASILTAFPVPLFHKAWPKYTNYATKILLKKQLYELLTLSKKTSQLTLDQMTNFQNGPN